MTKFKIQILTSATLLLFAMPLLVSAHRSGCHRWHSCPSDTGSYSCGDAGHPCQYPTYPKSGGVVYPSSDSYKDCYNCPLKKVPTTDSQTLKEMPSPTKAPSVLETSTAIRFPSQVTDQERAILIRQIEEQIAALQKQLNALLQH